MPDIARQSTPIIFVDDIRLTLATAAGRVNILRGLSLAVAYGESVGIVGPSGSGKSTLLAVIAGLERPTSGRVLVAGHDLAAMDEDALARFRRSHVGIVFQSFHLVPTMTAIENVAMPVELARHDDAFARAAECLDSVGIGHRTEHYPAQLSGGEQQRVALARAIVAKPDLLLADEPTGNLDGNTGRAIIELMFDTRERLGTTLVLVTHDAAIAERCDRIVHLADGRVTEDSAAESPDALSRSVD